MKNEGRRAVIYARYSAGPRQTGQSIEGQVAVCTKFLETRGYDLIRIYADEHITGRTDKRPQFQQMLADAAKEEFDVLCLYSSDRFSRNKYHSVYYKASLREMGIKILYAAENIPRDDIETTVFTATRDALSDPLELRKILSKINTLRDEKNPSKDELETLKRAQAKYSKQADNILDLLIDDDGSRREALFEKFDTVNAKLEEVNARISELEPYDKSITEKQIELGLRAFLKTKDPVLNTLVNRVDITQKDLLIYINLIEDDEVKSTGPIAFDQGSKWWAFCKLGRTLYATRWGLLVRIGRPCYTVTKFVT